MSTVISVENLGKKYTLHHQQREQYTALRDVIANGAASFGKKLLSPFTPSTTLRAGLHPSPAVEDFWALKDVSFEVKQGDRIGIIGRNGAGKSTLLKILSRITEPTTGRVRIKGRVASLLEVGTGFHPELTGRENIYLNGAILGMHRVEIKKKFDEIVDFAEIEKFLDTPVKRYSSGMYVRLAFAVAAHLEPEILVVDEVLAVGDAQFQKKCLGKMEDVSAKEGRTVLFVSHNMGAITNLTNKAILMNLGHTDFVGKTYEAVSRYINSSSVKHCTWVSPYITDEVMQITKAEILNNNNLQVNDIDVMEGFTIKLFYEVRCPVKGAVLAINIHSSDGTHILSLEDIDNMVHLLDSREPGSYVATVKVPGRWLNSGSYILRIGCGIPSIKSFENIEAIIFNLIETGETITRGHRAGYLLPMLEWTMTRI